MKDANDSKTRELVEKWERVHLEHDLVDLGFESFKRQDGLFVLYRYKHLVAEGVSSKAQGGMFEKARKLAAKPVGPGRGGKRAGSGRKALDAAGTIVTTIRLTGEQRASFDMLGGSAWLREFLDGVASGDVQVS